MSTRSLEPAISIDHLTRVFGSRIAVDSVTLEAARGSLAGIVGPDGAGKTTLIRMLAGVLPPTSGDARLNGVSVRDDPEGVKRGIAYMSQRFGLYTDLTVAENIEFYADLYEVPRVERRRRLDELYTFSGLGPFSSRLAGTLSGGMKQKLGLCCALIHQPAILLLDEPTFGVDPLSRHELWRFMHEMLASGVTILLSTSYLDEAERCDRVALLNEGRLLDYDEPLVMQQSLAHGATRLPTLDDVFVARLGSARPTVRLTPEAANA
jgi:ABC-2 type transport system ATP-binding protein